MADNNWDEVFDQASQQYSQDRSKKPKHYKLDKGIAYVKKNQDGSTSAWFNRRGKH